jgi:hypothetical protein
MKIKFLLSTGKPEIELTDLSGADLSGADLSGADLSGADLSGADLSGADLSGAEGILRLGPTSDGYELFAVLGKTKGTIFLKAGCKWEIVKSAKKLATTAERKLFFNFAVAWGKQQWKKKQ